MLVLLDVQIISTRQIPPARQLKRQLGVVWVGEDVWDHSLLVHIDTENLTLFVNTDDTVRRLVLRGHEDSLSGDTVHIDAGPRLKIVKVDETILCDEVNNSMLLGNLHGDGKVIGSLRGKVHIDGLLDEWWVRSGMINLNNMQLIKGRRQKICSSD